MMPGRVRITLGAKQDERMFRKLWAGEDFGVVASEFGVSREYVSRIFTRMARARRKTDEAELKRRNEARALARLNAAPELPTRLFWPADTWTGGGLR